MVTRGSYRSVLNSGTHRCRNSGIFAAMVLDSTHSDEAFSLSELEEKCLMYLVLQTRKITCAARCLLGFVRITETPEIV